MGLRTCKRCGKQYDPSKGNAPIGSYCSTRCFELDLKQKQQELDRKNREREKRRAAEKRKYAQSVQRSSGSSRQNSSNQSNDGCGLNVGEWLIIIVLFIVGLFIYSKCSGDDSTSTSEVGSDNVVENKVGAEKKKEQEITIEEQQWEEDIETIDSCLMDSIEESPCIDSLEVEEWEVQEVTNDSAEVTP